MESLDDGQIVGYLICDAIRKMEEHEFREWFKFEGNCVRDPHPQEKVA